MRLYDSYQCLKAMLNILEIYKCKNNYVKKHWYKL